MMGEVTSRRNGELMQGVFRILATVPEGMPVADLLARLEVEVPPTDYENSEYPNRPGVRRRDKIVRFASIAFVKGGWLRKQRGTWIATEEGLAAIRRYQDPEELTRAAAGLYREWKRSQPVDDSDGIGEAQILEETSAVEEAEEAAWSEIRAHLLAMPPYDFQDLVATLLRAMDYHVNYVSPPGPDGGLDIVAHTDPLGAMGPRIKVQVKRKVDKTDVDGLRAFMSLLGTQDVGLFVTTGGFTAGAEREARSQESRRITLIDVDRLFELWVEHYDQIPEEERALLPLRRVYFLDPRD
jgi:restriction system protein